MPEWMKQAFGFIRTALSGDDGRTNEHLSFESDFRFLEAEWAKHNLNLFVLYYLAAHRGTLNATAPWLKAIARLRRLHNKGKLALLGQAARLIRDEVLPYERTRSRKQPYTSTDIESCVPGLELIERILVLDIKAARRLGHLPKRGGQPHAGRMGLADFLPEYFELLTGSPRHELCCKVSILLGHDLILQQQQQDRKILKKRKLGRIDNPLISLDRGLR